MSLQRERRSRSARPAGLELSAVSHGFDGTGVLEDVTLSVRQGETLAVIGPSGTGKTTLLRLLALFDRPDHGTIALDGEDLWSLSKRERLAVRRRIGMVFQQANLFETTVAQNVRYGIQVRRDWRERVRRWLSRMYDHQTSRQVSETLEVVGLVDADTQPATSLSGGEAQRVAFARAIVYDPDFLLLDEPTSDLDPRNTAIIEEAIETTRKRGLGVVIATHDMHQAERVADRVAVVLGGEVIEVGPTHRVFNDPDDPRAQKFIEGELVY